MDLFSLFNRFFGRESEPAATIVTPIEVLAPTAEEGVYVLRSQAPWGDYGHILVNGSSSFGRNGEPLHIHRTGPFMPPITFPDFRRLVVSDPMRQAMISAGFR